MPLHVDLSAYFDGAGQEFIRPTIAVPVSVTASANAGASANNVALAAVANATNFVTGFEVTGAGATGASNISITLTGTKSGTMNYSLSIPAGATTGVTPLIVQFTHPIPASAANTAITLNVPSFGAGNTAAAATIHGFRL